MEMFKKVIKFWGYSALVLMLPINLYLGAVLWMSANDYNYKKRQYEMTVENMAEDLTNQISEELANVSEDFDTLTEQNNKLKSSIGDQQKILNELQQVRDLNEQLVYSNQHLYTELQLAIQKFNQKD